MKAATRAYDEGDIARLLDLEAAWSRSGAGAPARTQDDAQRCRELETELRALRAQIRVLDRELRELRRATDDPAFGEPMDAVFSEAERDLDELERMRDFVKSFRDGKISLATFREGPPPALDDMPYDLDDLDDDDAFFDDPAYEDVLHGMLGVLEAIAEQKAAPPRAKRRR